MSVRPFHSSFLNQLHDPLTLIFCMCMNHNRSSSGIESQVHRARSWVMVGVRVSKGGNTFGSLFSSYALSNLEMDRSWHTYPLIKF